MTPRKVLPSALAFQRDGRGCSQRSPPLKKVGSKLMGADLLQAGLWGAWWEQGGRGRFPCPGALSTGAHFCYTSVSKRTGESDIREGREKRA